MKVKLVEKEIVGIMMHETDQVKGLGFFAELDEREVLYTLAENDEIADAVIKEFEETMYKRDTLVERRFSKVKKWIWVVE